MKASGLLHCALRSPDPVRIGKFYASLFDCGFFVHPVLAGLGVAIVKIASPESVFRGLLEFWPLDLLWDGATASLRRIPKSLPQMQNRVALRVDWSKEQILEELNGKGIAARYEPRGTGFNIVGFDDPDGNFVEVFPGIETADLPPEAFSASGELERVMAEMAVWVNSVAVIRDGQTIFPLAPPAPNS